ncbi:MAG: 50S ribosomal protein L37ae [Nanoarchaeota archaeon]|nr:50S ribosomal protein L37ae [Nanoarchaeota archaeon]
MAEIYKSTKKFGTRYGRTLKGRFGKIEAEQRKKHICPYCRKESVKRVAVGIWNCKKCDKKFTGRAYTLAIKKKAVVKSEEEQE